MCLYFLTDVFYLFLDKDRDREKNKLSPSKTSSVLSERPNGSEGQDSGAQQSSSKADDDASDRTTGTNTLSTLTVISVIRHTCYDISYARLTIQEILVYFNLHYFIPDIAVIPPNTEEASRKSKKKKKRKGNYY